MKLTGSLVNAYYVCKRKLWLFAHELSPDPDWELLELGRIITEDAYKRDRKELSSEGMKIDVLKRESGDFVVGEIKKSSKGLKPAIMQLAFYLYQLKQKGLQLKGELLIPKERKKINVELTEAAEQELKTAFAEMEKIILAEKPPESKRSGYCRNCAYFEFCYA